MSFGAGIEPIVRRKIVRGCVNCHAPFGPAVCRALI
jgi:hypothetical protein